MTMIQMWRVFLVWVSMAFKDRGAIERLDLTQPEASLAVPLDQSKVAPVDLNNTLHAVDRRRCCSSTREVRSSAL